MSRQQDVAESLPDAKEVTPKDPQVDHTAVGTRIWTKAKGKTTLLRIKFSDGTVIEEPEVAETFRKFVLKVGIEKVRSLGIIRNKVPLVSNTIDSKYKSQQRDLGDGWYLMICSTTPF